MIHRQEAVIGGRVMSIETGRVAEQASGAVLVRYGDTVILARDDKTRLAKTRKGKRTGRDTEIHR